MDRRALARQYKESRPPMGVYRIRNRTTDRWLLGSSANLPAILNRHRFQLSVQSHPNRALQDDWNALGREAFEFEVLDVLEAPDRADYDPADELKVLEEMWLDKLSPLEEKRYRVKRTTEA